HEETQGQERMESPAEKASAVLTLRFLLSSLRVAWLGLGAAVDTERILELLGEPACPSCRVPHEPGEPALGVLRQPPAGWPARGWGLGPGGGSSGKAPCTPRCPRARPCSPRTSAASAFACISGRP